MLKQALISHRCRGDGLRPPLQSFHNFRFGSKGAIEVNDMAGQLLVALIHQIVEYLQEIQAVKDDGFISGVFRGVVPETFGVLSPVEVGAYVVAGVIAIVPATFIVFYINAIDTVFVKVIRLFRVDKGMLSPVAHHSEEPENEKRNDEGYERCLEVDNRQDNNKNKEAAFADHQPPFESMALFMAEVLINIKGAPIEEPPVVRHKRPEAVALILHRAASVFLHIVFCMVHSNVMYKVSFRRVPEKGRQYPGQVIVHPVVLLFKKYAVAGTVQHEAKGALEI